jgi:hypothetical protein
VESGAISGVAVSLRDRVAGFLRSLGDELPRAVDVGVVLEDHVTCESPNFDTERRSVDLRQAAHRALYGYVTKRSTSSGPSAGAVVRICTWTFVMSGTASIGRRRAAWTPATARTAVRARTRKRFPKRPLDEALDEDHGVTPPPPRPRRGWRGRTPP